MFTGCLAVIRRTDTGNKGVVVRVGKFLGCVPNFKGRDRWAVDVPLVSHTADGSDLDFVYHVGGWQLDPVEEDAKQEIEEKMEAV